ncbi:MULTISPECIES: carbohydrate ABC transporter permease [Bacillus]|uniref:Sugar ABC transporter permease n=1 Tax=Bacillus cereus TaxID=1396 RepID=A0A2A8IV95_BACCE|nr:MULTISPECIES: carbohydrate ABC transporter permease [Bacillus]MDH4419887.1 carbohydrate ABC transporter permease [Bacillus cereus]PER23447.1 sugar ABC transporter permease [Bacillus cereus]PGU05307.1 sugar ABC transporter permease [Bacillus cereus]PGZ69546.1 sugar ABC transporter permease [Bacillus sp. AFS029637]
MKRTGLSDRVFNIINNIFVSIIVLLILYPIIFVLSASISDPLAVSSGKMWLWPVDITFKGFKMVFQNDAIWLGYRNTIIYTVLGTLLHLLVLLPCSYALSRTELKGKKIILWFILFTMLFNGGLVPTYLVVKSLGMLNTVWAMVIPGVVGAWSILVARTFFQQNIPVQLVEASKMDGASDFTIFWRVVLPLSIPIITVMALFHAVGLWNQYFSALIYLSDEKLYPLQLILREILIVNDVGNGGGEGMTSGLSENFMDQVKIAAQLKYAVIIVSALPLLIIYPFIQKYLIKGMLIGSVKE